ncbi:galactose-3-O-sulfotransferase 3 isoform X2 [Oryzias melastigma]|nr:galactose-3-O-sulfotransferase 3 isoform X2 [Oryzias melastigma]
MSLKKIFLLLVVICTVSLLLHNRDYLTWYKESFHVDCPHPPPCQKPKHTNIVFLKTHKTASTTMQNLLFRFGERNNLTVALPIQACGHQFCYPQSFKAQFVHPHTLPANVVTNHMRFNKTALQRMMPNDTIYITILREPVSMFESLFTYYSSHCESFRRVPNGSLEVFLNRPSFYYRPSEFDSSYAHNCLTFDLGGDKDRPANDKGYARSFATELDQVFSLVMISEYFDESLVLLRHLLSWDLEDILYVKLNMRTEDSKKSVAPGLPAKIRAWNSIDSYLYDYFNATFWRKLSELGLTYVEKEVQLLQDAQERLMKTCFGREEPLFRSTGEIKRKDLRPWKPNEKVDIVGYDLPANISRDAQKLCLKYIMPELSYTEALLRSQSLRQSRIKRKTTQKSTIPQLPTHTAQPRHSQVSRNHPAKGPAPVTGAKSIPNPKSIPKQAVITKSKPKSPHTKAL